MSKHLLHARSIVSKDKIDLSAYAAFSCWFDNIMKRLRSFSG